MKETTKAKLAALQKLHDENKDLRITSLFAEDPNRFDTFSERLNELLFDFSKTNIDEAQLGGLLEVAAAADVQIRASDMFSGTAINETEERAVLHTALRNLAGSPVLVDGLNVMPEVKEVRARMVKFADAVRDGSIAGKGGKFTDVVNIGIGGSDLGPNMATLALHHFHDGPRTHFVSNVDGADILQVLEKVEADTTLFIVASKTFTTQETMTNANTAKDWLEVRLGTDAVADHFVALSTALDKTSEFGIPDDRIFGFWDWVGGRYSLWSAIGLSIMLAVGAERFEEFLAGAHATDEHFRTAPLRHNIPVLMALIGVWHRNICGYDTHAVLPYDQNLSRFPAYLQQLDMESNGKQVTMSGEPVSTQTGPIVWGEPGTNGQHAFYQLIHQGTSVVPCDILVAANASQPVGDHHEKLVANALAQSEALMVGKSVAVALQQILDMGVEPERARILAEHKKFPGDRPTCTLLYPELTPFVLGQLIALYEHKVFVQGVIWGINSFDQWGVELGKELAGDLLPKVKDSTLQGDRNGSTDGLLRAFHNMRKA